MEIIYRKENTTGKYYEFRFKEDWEKLDILLINDKEYKLDITLKNIIRVFSLYSSDYPEEFKTNKCLEILGLYIDLELKDKATILNELIEYIIDISQNSNGEKTFDLEEDYKYYYVDFLKLGIDLNKKEISFWEFNTILDGILLTENSVIGKVLEYRLWKPASKSQKQFENEDRKFHNEMKLKYALKGSNKTKVVNGLEKMFRFAETKAKGVEDISMMEK